MTCEVPCERMHKPIYERFEAFFSHEQRTIIDRMIDGIHLRSTAKHELLLFGPGALTLFERHGIRIRGLAPGQRFDDVSKTIATMGGTDEGPHTLAVFVWPDRTLYVKDAAQSGVFCHELGHALDFVLALERGVNPNVVFTAMEAAIAAKGEIPKAPFLSELDDDVRATIGRACNAASDYGATSPTEGWAEAIRAYLGVNDGSGLFAMVSSAKLRALNRPLYGFILGTFVDLNGRRFEQLRRAA